MHNKRHGWRTLLKAMRTMLFLILAGVQLLYGQAPVQREYQVKAAFLYNFTQFIEWPPESFAASDAPFIIGIVGNDPFGAYLDEIVAGEKTMGHPIVVKRYDDINDASGCHLLFISNSYIKKDTDNLPRENMLTVSDANNFMASGGIIGFFTENGKIKFQVNLTAAKSANLAISSKLLRVAKVTDK